MLATQCQADDELEFVGDASLLQVVRDAQETNGSAFPRGRMTAKVRLNIPAAADVRSTTADVEIIWSEDRTYWKYDFTQERADPKHPTRVERAVRMVETGKERLWYSPDQKRVDVDFKSDTSPHEVLLVSPDHLWYCTAGNADQAWKKCWRDYLDPEKYRNGRVIFSVDRGEEQDVVVTRHHSFELNGNELDVMLTIVVSLSRGGNVVRFDRTPIAGAPPGVDAYGEHGEYEWSALGDGRFAPRAFRFRQYVQDPDEPELTFDVDIESFDPNPTIKPNQFTLAALEIEPGTIVEERGGQGRTYRYGKEPVLLKEEELDKLADEQRARGFANPKREVRP